MKVCSKATLSKNPHHAKASQLTFIECQSSGLYMTQNITERSLETDLKITRTVKTAKNAFKFLKSLLKYYFDKIFLWKMYLRINDLRIIFHVQTLKRKVIIILHLKIVQNNDTMKLVVFSTVGWSSIWSNNNSL